MATIICGMFLEDVVYQNLLAEAYFAAGRHSEAQDVFRAAVHRDNSNELAKGSL
jgi:predicted Zn-dependent protease